MKIGIDIRSLQEGDRFRGIGAYTSNLLEALSRIDRDNEYTLHCWSDRNPVEMVGLASTFRFRIVSLGAPHHITAGKLRNCVLRDIRVGPRDVDVYLQPSPLYGLPRGRIPKAAVVYDLIPLIFRDKYWAIPAVGGIRNIGPRALLRRASDRWIYRWSLKQMASAERIIAISEATKRDLLSYIPHLGDRVTVIPLAADPHFQPTGQWHDTLAKFGIKRPFLLYVGGVDFRKNVPALVRSYNQVREEGHNLQLALVGKEFALEESDHPDVVRLRNEVAASPFRLDIKPIGFIGRPDLAALYTTAFALVFPSLYEGFGLPVIEAMACGCPVIAYRTSSIPEVAGTAAILLEPSENIGSAVRLLIDDDGLRHRLIAAGFAQAAKFSWDRTARDTLRVLQEIHLPGPRRRAADR